MTKTELAKGAASQLVAMQATSLVRNVVTNNTETNPDGIPVRLGSWVAGEFIAMTFRPLTDKAVDATITKFQSWKQNRKNASK